ncbi:MAG: hypothetical protein HY260_00085 [Chloroflexi bacterium]|nr:hypothetical protein [Chloroflexota bacterium]
MTISEVKERLGSIVDVLPSDKAQLLLDFATFLKQQFRGEVESPAQIESDNGLDDWDREIVAAEEYWFSLPESTRQNYSGKTVAVAKDRILDADGDIDALTGRIEAQYPDLPVLYIEAEAERLPTLVILSPRFE